MNSFINEFFGLGYTGYMQMWSDKIAKAALSVLYGA